jgi:alpha-ribazole phosphatase
LATIFLIRHGEVEGNSGDRPTFTGWADKPLTARGERQAEAVARRLGEERLHAVYSSDLQRAVHTAERIAAVHSLKVQSDANLREVNYGAWEGLGETEILAGWRREWELRLTDPENHGPPDGESYAALWQRMEPAWKSIVARHRDENVALVGHNGTIRILLCHLLGMATKNYRRVRVSNGGLSRVEVHHGMEHSSGWPHVVVSCINETRYLRGV